MTENVNDPFASYPHIPTPAELRARREADSITEAMKACDSAVRLLTESETFSAWVRGSEIVLNIASRRLTAAGWVCSIEVGAHQSTLNVSAPTETPAASTSTSTTSRRSR